MDTFDIDYNEQMLNYYPEVIKAIREFQVLIETQSLEVEEMHEELAKILGNAYVSTANEERISEWEQYLGIVPLDRGDDDFEKWLSDRRDTILARVYRSPKLNSKSISEIVKIFTGGTATSYFKDSTIYVSIHIPPASKKYQFSNVEQEILNKIPAHLNCQISRNYYTWGDIKDNHATWQEVKDIGTWNDVLLFVPFE